METPGDPKADLLGAPSPSDFSPGHPEREKLVKLEGQSGGAGRAGRAVCLQRGEGERWARVLPLAPCSGLVFVPRPAQDPLYDVPGAGGGQAGGPQRPGRTVSLRERLLLTRPVWLQLRASAAAALHVLRTEPPGVSPARTPETGQWTVGGRGTRHGGPEPPTAVHSQTFLVRKSNTRQCQALCMRLPEASGPSFVSSHYIQESPVGERGWLGGEGLAALRVGRREVPQRTTSLPISGVYLEGSELVFPDLVQLICAYCHAR